MLQKIDLGSFLYRSVNSSVEPNGEPALLKRREYLRRDAAEKLWKELLRLGRVTTAPAWGAEVEP